MLSFNNLGHWGRLGNQMFQYAAARSLSLRLGSELYFDTSWFDNIPSTDTKRWYELDCFNIKITAKLWAFGRLY